MFGKLQSREIAPLSVLFNSPEIKTYFPSTAATSTTKTNKFIPKFT
jgi:hypothetical protein